MRFTSHERPVTVSLADQFYCRSKRRVVVMGDCLDDFVDATSLEKRRSACFQCPHGRRNREAYASSGETD